MASVYFSTRCSSENGMQGGHQFLYINEMECLDTHIIMEKLINVFGVNTEQSRKRRNLEVIDTGRQVCIINV